MRIFVDSASLTEIEEWDEHPWVSGFTTNPTLMKGAGATRGPGEGMLWAKRAVSLTDKPISIDGPEDVWDLGPNVYRKVTALSRNTKGKVNLTAVCHVRQVTPLDNRDIISVFCGRIMDTGRNPQSVIQAAQRSGGQVLWASVREPYNIVQAEDMGCDIITVPPTILRKFLDWHGRPLERVGELTIQQFDRDREGIW